MTSIPVHSLVFAGLLLDFVPMITGRPLGTRRETTLIFWGMTLGAFALVLGPWLGRNVPLLVSGLVLHLAATAWLLILIYRAFCPGGRPRDPGETPACAEAGSV